MMEVICKVKVKLSLCLINQALCQEIWKSGGIAPPFFTSALDRGEWLTSHPDRFTPEEGAHSIHWIGGWDGPRAGFDIVGKRKSLHCKESNPSHPAQ
jgi:hypothetical protein